VIKSQCEERLRVGSDFLFDFDRADVRPEADDALAEVAQRIEAAQKRVVVEGHTDGKGTDGYNQALSERRAAAVRTALIERGARGNQLLIHGYGKSRPIAPNEQPDGSDDPAGRQKNAVSKWSSTPAANALGRRCAAAFLDAGGECCRRQPNPRRGATVVRQSLTLSIAIMLTSSGLGHARSGPELTNKMNAVTAASMAAFAKHPEEDGARQNRVQEIIGRYATPKNEKGGAGALDALCSEYDELLAVYK
jgi:hypothetical protein